MQKCEAEGPSRPVNELLDRPVERVLEYRAYLGDLLDCGRKAGVDTNDLEVPYYIQFRINFVLPLNQRICYSPCGSSLKTGQTKEQVPVPLRLD